jgi:hypothetical protein
MSVSSEPAVGPLQLLIVGFETLDRLRGDIARELRDLRGRGLVRVLDARLVSRDAEGALTEVDLNQLIGEPVLSAERPAAHLLGLNGAGHLDAAGRFEPEAFHATAGFAVDDLRRLTDAIPNGEHAAVVLVEHVWARRLRQTIREAGGLLLAQGMLTPEVVMIAGAELEARADAEAAIELAEAARGAALLEALATLAPAGGPPAPPEARTGAAIGVVRALVNAGFVREAEAGDAVDALAQAGIVEAALLQGAAAEAEDLLAKLEPGTADPGDDLLSRPFDPRDGEPPES